MSAGGLAVAYPGVESEREPSGWDQLRRWFERLTPSQGWATLTFLAAVLMVVGSSVNAAGWVDTPGLIPVLIWGALAGLILAKIKVHAVFLHLAGLGLGFIVVVWQTASLFEGMPLVERVQELWTRLNVWYEAATGGGISTDLIPFSMAILTTAWLLAYLGSWFVFRRNNVWVALVLSAIAILTNLSFLPDKFASRFFLFLFFAMLLVVRMRIVQNEETWSKTRVQFSWTSGWLTIHAAVWFGVTVLLLAALLPLRVVVSQPVADLWKAGRTPVAFLEEEFARLFGGIPSRKDVTGRFFGDTLPFLGKISFGGEVVLWAETEYPSYWLSQTYSEYTSRGWIAGRAVHMEVGPQSLSPPRADLRKRVPVDQTLQFGFDTSKLLSGGSLDWVSRDAVVETLEPKSFGIDLRDSSLDSALPADIQDVAKQLREALRAPSVQPVEVFLSRTLPGDLVLVSAASADGGGGPATPDAITLARKEPITPDVVSWQLAETVPANGAYSMVSLVSVATDNDLRGASEDYGHFITDHYQQLPNTVPQRVRSLAEQLTAGAETPMDKALSIRDYLRGPGFEYSQDIEKPPFDADGVDHFLFETRTGYSDYFASSMVVMLRAVGVPSRMAAGYAPGEFSEEAGRRVIKDSDSHGWAQVYFPEYGWIDFEPTPQWPTHERRLPGGPGSPGFEGLSEAELGEAEDVEDPFVEEVPEAEQPGLFASATAWNPASVAIRLLIAVAAVVTLWAAGRWTWARGLAEATPGERAYTKMSRLGAMAGIRRRANQTPGDYAASLGGVAPAIADQTRRIAWAFANDRYGGEVKAEADEEALEEDWATVRGTLLGRAISRFMRLSPGGGR